MSRDVLEMVQEMDFAGLERQLAMQCAPLLTGIKVSNLLILPASCENAIHSLLAPSDLSSFVLRRTERQLTLLLFREKELTDFLAGPEVKRILLAEGYPEGSLADVLEVLGRRYRDNRNGEGAFPHEMGFFLGYPTEDVRGFMEQKGEHCLYSGYWKVYRHVEAKKRIFRAYENARETVIQLLYAGVTLPEILLAYEKDREGSSALPA